MKSILFTLLMYCTCFKVYGQWEPLLFTFDTIEAVHIDSNIAGNVWQIGIPQKATFDSAYSVPNAIVTDTVNPYPPSSLSEFIVKTPTYMNGFGGIRMTFQHRFETDSLEDGGAILVSYDGDDWMEVWQTLHPYGNSGMYSDSVEVNSLESAGFTGNSGGWQEVSCYWNYPPTDSLYIKFRFTSDSIHSNKDGWMIDELSFTYDLGIDVESPPSYTLLKVYPNPISGTVYVDYPNPKNTQYMVEIRNLHGQVLSKSISQNTNRFQIDVRGFKPGLYFIHLLSHESEHSAKFIVR